MALHTTQAEKIHRYLKQRGVLSDYRGNSLRFGPAPYISDQQIDDAMSILQDVVK